ncbi:uncharacterized protein LOC121708620 [Alosa sapidissima]|uniref:uncharacterized protein LOC121708620 n=1 Tax=Alosa sapidissima TaxID=34773 RepID=UPI001C09E01A|nr:uncharacterized protein LOC121708620 [Alosa sapidissima]
MWEQGPSYLKRENVIIPLPSMLADWEDDMKKCPRITYGEIFRYFIQSVATDGEAMNNIKSSETYQYLHSHKIGPVLLKEVANGMVYLKADVEPSQSCKSPHHRAWVLVSASSGEIQTAGCSCIAGPGRSCSHSAAVLWKVQLTMMCTGLQSCKLVIWTSTEHLELEVPYDKEYTKTQMCHLKNFYFTHMLPRLADDFLTKTLKLCQNFVDLVNVQGANMF